MRLIDKWFDSSVVESRNGVPEALDSNPVKPNIFHHLIYFASNVRKPILLGYRVTVIEGFVDESSYSWESM